MDTGKLVAARFERDELYSKIASNLHNQDAEEDKTNLGRRLAVRLLVGQNGKDNTAPPSAKQANSALSGGKMIPCLDTHANVQRVVKRPVGHSRLSAVTSAVTSAADPHLSTVSTAAATAAARKSPQRLTRKRTPRTMTGGTSDGPTVMPSSSPGGPDDPMDEFFAIMEQFVDEPEEMEYLRAAEAAARNSSSNSSGVDAQNAPSSAGVPASTSRPHVDKHQLGRSPPQQHQLQQQPKPAEAQHQRRPAAVSFEGFPTDLSWSNRGLDVRDASPTTKTSAPHPVSASSTSSTPASAHHGRSKSRDLSALKATCSMREWSESGAATGRKLAAASMSSLSFSLNPNFEPSGSHSRSFSDRFASEGAANSAASSGEIVSHSSIVNVPVSPAATAQKNLRSSGSFREREQREVETLVEALRAEVRAKDLLLEASEKERDLLSEELRNLWEHAGKLERQVDEMQAAGTAMEREIEALRAEVSAPASMRGIVSAQRRCGSQGDMSAGNHVLEMERTVGELTRRVATKDGALQRVEDELARARSDLHQAEQERDSLADEMEAALSSWAAESPIPAACGCGGGGGSRGALEDAAAAATSEAGRLVHTLERMQGELQTVKRERDALLLAVGGKPARRSDRSNVSVVDSWMGAHVQQGQQGLQQAQQHAQQQRPKTSFSTDRGRRTVVSSSGGGGVIGGRSDEVEPQRMRQVRFMPPPASQSTDMRLEPVPAR